MIMDMDTMYDFALFFECVFGLDLDGGRVPGIESICSAGLVHTTSGSKFKAHHDVLCCPGSITSRTSSIALERNEIQASSSVTFTY